MIGIRTEKAIKKVIALKDGVFGQIHEKKSGNHVISFFNLDGELIASFTLKSLIAKRVAKRKAKK